MKRIAILSLSAILVAQMPRLVRAENAPPPPPAGDHVKMGEPMVEHRLKHLTKKLDLSTDQQSQVKQVLQAETDQIKPLRQQMIAIRKQTDEKIQAVLTDAQKKKFTELRENQKEEMKERMHEHHGKDKPQDDNAPKS
jgi:Spy/CpxP family protein refolding chaperone